MLEIIHNMRRAAERLSAGELPDPVLCAWLSRGLHAFAEHRAGSLEEAFGLRFGKGGMPWWKDEAVRVRNAALRRLAALRTDDRTATARARRVKRMVDRYGTGRWRFDRALPAMPVAYAGKAEESLWLAFKSGAPVQLSERQLRSILPP